MRYTETPPKGEDYTDENGIRTTVEYTINDDGKKVKARLACPGTKWLSGLRCILSNLDHAEDEARTPEGGCRPQRSGAEDMGQVRSGEGEQTRPRSRDDDRRRERLLETQRGQQGACLLYSC